MNTVAALPNAHYRELKGQKHAVKPQTHAPVLGEFFTSNSRTADARTQVVGRFLT